MAPVPVSAVVQNGAGIAPHFSHGGYSVALRHPKQRPRTFPRHSAGVKTPDPEGVWTHLSRDLAALWSGLAGGRVRRRPELLFP